MTDLQTDIRYLKGIGEKKALAFHKLGVFSLYDLLHYFPRRYEDRSVVKSLALTQDGETVCVRGMVADTPRLARIRRGLDLVKFRIVDESGMAEITYFNQAYRKDQISKGESYIFYGKIEGLGVRRSMVNPVCEKESDVGYLTGRILPVYRIASGLTQRNLLDSVRQGLALCGETLPELLPEDIRRQEELCSARFAFENIHFPADAKALEIARRRMIFEELFVLACALGKLREKRIRASGIQFAPTDYDVFWRALPFTPTGAQLRAVREAEADLTSGTVMNRLVQGDVGSGKTLVAAALIWAAWKNGRCSAFMAPTEILAQQHLATLTALLSPFGVRIGKLTGSSGAKEKREIKTALREGKLDLVIGTHALFSEDVEYANLGLVITDEQHRFGVEQRSALIEKGARPHVLVMSATPIPRTLALILYGDLDVSIIDELPPGRQKVDTFAVDESYRSRLNGFIRKLAGEGRQIFVVCPMVEENEELSQELKSAEEHAKELQQTFPELRVACIHGRLKPKEKDAIMASFVSGETDILVSTTVIEVGVDVPNAALMVVENAERFGLSQLHQLRGRVGRGTHKSWCILVSDASGDEVRARLDILCKTNDGFRIAEEDLRLRGPGDFFGSRQSGLPEMHVADLGADAQILQRAQQAALRLLEKDPELSSLANVPLREHVERLFKTNTDRFN
jgi:ATP-dependent DNA helicase RecG